MLKGPVKFRYIPGRSYAYRYEVDVASFVDGTTGSHESRIHLAAKVHLDVHSPCDWTLRVCFRLALVGELADSICAPDFFLLLLNDPLGPWPCDFPLAPGLIRFLTRVEIWKWIANYSQIGKRCDFARLGAVRRDAQVDRPRWKRLQEGAGTARTAFHFRRRPRAPHLPVARRSNVERQHQKRHSLVIAEHHASLRLGLPAIRRT